MNMAASGSLPVIVARGKTLPEVWEKAVLSAWREGREIRTEYDRPGDPPSRDCTMIMVVEEPLGEPRIHRAFPGGLEDLEAYRQEVLDGIHDHWINPAEGKWSYTYHSRLFRYELAGKTIDQVAYLIDKLARVPYSRRAQAITWSPALDPQTDEPPCLQRVFCRLVEDEERKLVLNLNTHWRSRDAYKAAFMNVFAFTDLQRWIAGEISRKRGEEIRVGQYVDVSDSFHIYGSYHREFTGFLRTLESRSFAERTWTSEFAEPFFAEARKKLAAEKTGKPEAGRRREKPAKKKKG